MIKMQGDFSEAIRFGSAMQSLDYELNTDRHLDAVTHAGYEILRDAFNQEMHMQAQTPMGTLLYHHMYEWEHVGTPGAQLWRLRMGGRGAKRMITWDWMPSKTTVPTETNVNGTPKFLPSPGFDPGKLNRIHIFVWKAPVMEFGVTVTVRPRLSQVLVYPNNQQQGAGGRMGPGLATFSPHPETITPGGQVQGNFTAFFMSFFGFRAGSILDEALFSKRDASFRRAFKEKMMTGRRTSRSTKSFSFTPNAQAAREGKNIARAIAADSERLYYRTAANRKRRIVEAGDG